MSELQRVHIFSSPSRVPSPACLESSPSLTGQDSSPSPAGLESESRCLWLGSESESQRAEFPRSSTSHLSKYHK